MKQFKTCVLGTMASADRRRRPRKVKKAFFTPKPSPPSSLSLLIICLTSKEAKAASFLLLPVYGYGYMEQQSEKGENHKNRGSRFQVSKIFNEDSILYPEQEAMENFVFPDEIKTKLIKRR